MYRKAKVINHLRIYDSYDIAANMDCLEALQHKFCRVNLAMGHPFLNNGDIVRVTAEGKEKILGEKRTLYIATRTAKENNGKGEHFTFITDKLGIEFI